MTDFRDPAQQDAAAWDLAGTAYFRGTDLVTGCGIKVTSDLGLPFSSDLPDALPDGARRATAPIAIPRHPPSDVVAAALAVSRLDEPERKLVQMGLKEAGLYAGAIDGIIGPLSKAAMAAWRARG